VIPQPNRFGSGLARAQAVEPALPKLVPGHGDPIQRMALYLGLGLIFIQFTVLPQLTAYIFHTNLYLLYLVGVPAIVAMVLNGGIAKSFRARPAYYWTGFGCWMAVATPFSSWRGGSALFCFGYWRTALIVLFITGGMLLEWSDVKKAINVIAAAAIVNLVSARLLRDVTEERFGMSFGTIGNPNDYAAHLLLVLPFLLWMGLSGKLWRRLVALPCLGYGLYLILATASRGALVALGFDVLAIAILGTGRQKAALALLGPIAALVLVAVVPVKSWQHLATVWSHVADSAEAAKAIESAQAREYTLETSLRYTLEHPLFGVGPQQFAAYEGGHERVIGTHGLWHDTHNSFTQAASECGIPGFLFFTCGTASTFLLLFKTFRQARRRSDCQDIRVAVFCILLGMIGFCVAITFLSFAYFFYLPAMAGLAIGVWSAVQREFQVRDGALQAGAA